MTQEEHLLVIMAEECNEVAQRISKALRFGTKEVQKGQLSTNSERIIHELNDLLAIAYTLKDKGVFDTVLNKNLIASKRERVNDWLKYSINECDTIDK